MAYIDYYQVLGVDKKASQDDIEGVPQAGAQVPS